MAENVESDKTSKAIRSEEKGDAADADQALLARRRLLKLGAYVPPAILGMAILGSTPAIAATVGSCSPTACQPCINVNQGSLRMQDRVQCRNAQASKNTKNGGS